MIDIQTLSESNEHDYKTLFYSQPYTLLYQSLEYRNFLRLILKDSQDIYLLAYEKGHIVGALPLFIIYNKKYGNAINSLPYFGSNGSFIINPDNSNHEQIKFALYEKLRDIEETNKVISSTIITNPFSHQDNFFIENKLYTYIDERLSQFVDLRKINNNDGSNAEEKFMSSFHIKTRRSIRKARKFGIDIVVDNSLQSFNSLFHLHKNNMNYIDGTYKSIDFFKAVHDTFVANKEYILYKAIYRGEVIAQLLVFYSNKTCDYFVPATKIKFRPLQPMSLMIFTAMIEAYDRRLYYWNWGGTWKSQEGVYRFKKHWGSEERSYNYFIKIFNQKILNLSPQELLAEYPNYYIIPFDQLTSNYNGRTN